MFELESKNGEENAFDRYKGVESIEWSNSLDTKNKETWDVNDYNKASMTNIGLNITYYTEIVDLILHVKWLQGHRRQSSGTKDKQRVS